MKLIYKWLCKKIYDHYWHKQSMMQDGEERIKKQDKMFKYYGKKG